MSEYWKRFWIEHGRSSVEAPIQYQVLRTLNKKPLDDDVFAQILVQIETALDLSPEDALLDLCCGNGAITTHLADRCDSAVAIDCSPDLLDRIDTTKHSNLTLRIEDVARADLPERHFSKALLYAGIQYFSEEEIVRLFCRIAASLRSCSRFYLGDIPDARRMWAFFNDEERETAYFDSLRNNKPVIGAWLDPIWLTKLGRYAGFDEIQVLQQPEHFPYAHYRFDMSMRKL